MNPIHQLQVLIDFQKKSMKDFKVTEIEKNLNDKNDKNYRFQILISLMLSSQTKDEISSQAVENLQKGLKGGLTASSLAKANEDVVKELIKRVCFYKTKAQRIIEVAKICERDYDGDIPKTKEELMAFKGVGEKMANLAMNNAWNEIIGIGVDVHIHRIANRLKWVKTQTPEQTEVELQKIFPKELWDPVNLTIVAFGQNICGAKKQKCDICPIAKSCPYHKSHKINESDNNDSNKQRPKKFQTKQKK